MELRERWLLETPLQDYIYTQEPETQLWTSKDLAESVYKVREINERHDVALEQLLSRLEVLARAYPMNAISANIDRALNNYRSTIEEG